MSVKITGFSTPLFGLSWQYVHKTMDGFCLRDQGRNALLDRKSNRKFVERDLIRDMYGRSAEQNIGYGLAIFDVDKLTQINQKFGENVGSEVLIHILSVLCTSKRFSKVGLCGDDTFFALFPNNNFNGGGFDNIKDEAEYINLTIAEHGWDAISKDLYVTCSVGCSVFDGIMTYSEWVTLAGIAMLQAKGIGGNVVLSENKVDKITGVYKEILKKNQEKFFPRIAKFMSTHFRNYHVQKLAEKIEKRSERARGSWS